MDFSKNTVSPHRVHKLLDKLSALNKEHSAKFHPAASKEKNIEQPQLVKIKKLPKLSAAEMIARLRMGKPITEQPHKKALFHRKNINQQENRTTTSNRDVALNQIMHSLSNTRRKMIENIINHDSSNDSVADKIKNKRLIDELTGRDLERPSLTLERDREREHERTQSHIRVRQRQHTR